MSICVTAVCRHGKPSMIWLGNGPDETGTYPWVHAAPVGPSRLEVCDAMPWATAEEAGEVCACGHEHREHAPGRARGGKRVEACTECPCPWFRHRPEDLARERRTDGAA